MEKNVRSREIWLIGRVLGDPFLAFSYVLDVFIFTLNVCACLCVGMCMWVGGTWGGLWIPWVGVTSGCEPCVMGAERELNSSRRQEQRLSPLLYPFQMIFDHDSKWKDIASLHGIALWSQLLGRPRLSSEFKASLSSLERGSQNGKEGGEGSGTALSCLAWVSP